MASNDPHHEKETELRQRENELRKREMEIRLRELEAELHQQSPATPAPHVEVQTVYPGNPGKSAKPATRWQRWQRLVSNLAKFCLLMVVVLVAIRVSFLLANIIIIGTVAFVAYKLFFDSKPNR